MVDLQEVAKKEYRGVLCILDLPPLMVTSYTTGSQSQGRSPGTIYRPFADLTSFYTHAHVCLCTHVHAWFYVIVSPINTTTIKKQT